MTVKMSAPLRVVVVVALVVALLFAVVWLVQRRLLYFPDRAVPPPAAAVLPGARDVTLRTADGLDLGAWLVPGGGHLAVLVAHGNAGSRLGRAPLAAALAARGLTVLLVDYRGYGGNPGRPTEEGLALDGDAARAYLVDEAGFSPDRIIYFGESLGAAVVTALATRHPPAALVLRSPFAGLPAVARHHYPFLPAGMLLRDRFPVSDQIKRIGCPTLVVHGTADTVVPAEQSRTVAADAAGPVTLTVVEGADHNDAALTHGPHLINAVAELADGLP